MAGESRRLKLGAGGYIVPIVKRQRERKASTQFVFSVLYHRLWDDVAQVHGGSSYLN